MSSVIQILINAHVKVILAGMRVPESYGKDYARDFAAIFPRLAAQWHVTLIPFLFEGVAGAAKLNEADGIHPNEDGLRRIADLVLPYVEKNL